MTPPCVCLTWAVSTSVVRSYCLAAAAVRMLPMAQSTAGRQALRLCLTTEVHPQRMDSASQTHASEHNSSMASIPASSSTWHAVCLFNDNDCR